MTKLNISPWRHLWSSAENAIHELQLDSYKHSEAQTTQHCTKHDTLKKTGVWSTGEDYRLASTKSNAISHVEEMLIHVPTKNEEGSYSAVRSCVKTDKVSLF